MARFIDLPKDVIWLVLREVIVSQTSCYYGAVYWEWPHSNELPNEHYNFSQHTGAKTRDIALICKLMLSIVRSKCIRFGARWSFVKGALVE